MAEAVSRLIPNADSGVISVIRHRHLVIVDAGYAGGAPKLEAALKTISDKPVKYLLNTHYHDDHSEGNVYFGKTAIIIAHENARKKKAGSRTFAPSPAVSLPVITFTDQLTLHINGAEIHAIHFANGHTDGDTIYVFPQSKVVQTGDGFVNWEQPGFPAIDMDGDGSGGVQGQIDVAQYIIDHTPSDVKIIPGHGNVASKADVVKELAVLKSTIAVVQAGIDQGKTLDQLKQEKVLAQFEYLNTHIKTDVYLEHLYNALKNKKGSS
jgi:glyoxylase-like metal-dependent hydrolase (beta-lactamase superfamily II)